MEILFSVSHLLCMYIGHTGTCGPCICMRPMSTSGLLIMRGVFSLSIM